MPLRISLKNLKKLIEELKGKKLYRSSLVRMYYAEKPKTQTPTPFLETRVFMITTRPINWNVWKPRMEKELDWLEFVFEGLRSQKFVQKKLNEEIKSRPVKKGRFVVPVGRPERYVRYSIVGEEVNRKIDIDEAVGKIPPERGAGITKGDFSTTGLPVSEWKFYTLFRYACFFKTNGDIKREYNEREIRILEGVTIEDYKKWLRIMIENAEFRERYMHWVLARRGIEWKPEYTVTKVYMWKGRPVVTVRLHGRLIKGGFWIGRKL